MRFFFVIISSAIVSCSEAAILSLNYAKAKEIESNAKTRKEKKAAHKLLHVKEDLQKYISSIVVLNNIINIIGSMYVGYLAAKMFGEFYLGIVSGILTFLIILFSEIIPKIIGEKHSSKIALKVTGPLIIITYILKPVVLTLNYLTRIFVKDTGYRTKVSEGEIREMALLGKQEGSINMYESELIENVFDMNDIEVYDIMVPRTKIVRFKDTDSYLTIISAAKKTGFTRFPVTKDGEIVGLINIKDLFKFHGKENQFSIDKILRPIEYAPESMKLSTLEQKLRRNRTHMAVIVNEHGDFTGIVTLEDIFEELLGDIEDEFDQGDGEVFKKIANGHFIIDGSYDISELEEKLFLDLEIGGDYTTVNGYITAKLGRIPKLKEELKIKHGVFIVNKVNNKQILEVELKLDH